MAAKRAMDKARRRGIRIHNPYDYGRAFQYCPSEKEEFWLLEEIQKLGIDQPTVLDPTAGGGAIPFEALRLGCKTLANDINPQTYLTDVLLRIQDHPQSRIAELLPWNWKVEPRSQ